MPWAFTVEVYRRTDCDEEGGPYPLLYMRRENPRSCKQCMTPAAIGRRGHGDCRKNPEGFSGKRLQAAVRIICVP